MKIKVVYFISMILIMSSCNKSINNLKKDTVSFNSLPVEVKDFFYNIRNTPLTGRHEYLEFIYNSGYVPSTERDEYHWPNLYIFNTTYEYQFKTVGTLIGPSSWISHYLLIDKTNNISYKIRRGTPLPIIIFDREIFGDVDKIQAANAHNTLIYLILQIKKYE